MAISSSHNSIAFVAPCDAHCISSAMQKKYQIHCQILEHTQGVSVPQCYAYFHDILLCDRGDIEWSPSFLVTINMHILVLRWGLLDGT